MPTTLYCFLNSGSRHNFLLLKGLVCHTSSYSPSGMCQKVREGKHQHLGHHDLIKLIVVDGLTKLRILVLWFKFINMDIEAFIDTQTLTLGETPVSSVQGREGKTMEEEERESEKEEEIVG